MLAHQLSCIDIHRRKALPGSIEDPKDSCDWAGVKTMAPEGASLSLALDIVEVRGWMSFRAWSRPDGLLAGARSPADDLCERLFVLLVGRLIGVAG